jgi:hypothetical protein
VIFSKGTLTAQIATTGWSSAEQMFAAATTANGQSFDFDQLNYRYSDVTQQQL